MALMAIGLVKLPEIAMDLPTSAVVLVGRMFLLDSIVMGEA
jgi:hypothetical protein